jgi:hypothetical protein
VKKWLLFIILFLTGCSNVEKDDIEILMPIQGDVKKEEIKRFGEYDPKKYSSNIKPQIKEKPTQNQTDVEQVYISGDDYHQPQNNSKLSTNEYDESDEDLEGKTLNFEELQQGEVKE